MQTQFRIWIISLPALLLLLYSQAGFAQSALYVSKQTGETSTYSGSASKTTDKYESGTVSLDKVGPINYTVNPNSLSIGPNQSMTWHGTVTPDAANAPAAGSSAHAAILGNYTVQYSRPQGTGSGGTVLSTYNCNQGINDGCAYHGPSGGMHEIVKKIGVDSVSFTVYSIKVSLPDTITLPAGAGNTAVGTATATPFPAGGTYQWTSMSSSLTIISGANTQTPTLQLNDTTLTNSVVKVKYTIQGVSYTTQAVVKYSRCQCKPIVNSVFGPLNITFNAPPTQGAPDGQGFCNYDVNNASLNVSLIDFVTKAANVTNAHLSFKKNCKTGEIKDVTVSWDGNINVGEIQNIAVSIKHMDLTVATNGNLSGTVKLHADLNEDKDLTGKGIMILRKGVNGDFSFAFSGGNNFNGSFNFDGIKNINVDIVKDNKAIAGFKNGSLDASGKLDATFTANDIAYSTNAFTVKLNSLSLDFSYSLKDGFKLKNGSGSATVSNMQGVSGTVTLGLAYNQGNCMASISASNITAFSMTLQQLNLTVNFNSDFDMVEFNGSLQAKHNSFDVAINVSEFNVKNDVLTKFKASGKVKYSGFKFDLINSSYAAATGKLSVSAKVSLQLTGASMEVAVDKFDIAQDGTISIGKMSADLNKPPVSLHVDATFATNEFSGNFSGDFTSVGISGSAVVGSQPTFNYGYFKLTAGTNIPLGQTGLKITQIGGEAGFNYKIPEKTPLQGNYILGLTLGMADVANLCEVTGNPVIQLGNNNMQLSLNGTVKVLKNNTFFTGNLASNYYYPANKIDGSVSTDIKIPSSGFIFKSNNLAVNFLVANNAWSASGSNMGGKMFNGLVDFSQGNISMSGSLSNPTNMTGTLGGKASASLNQGLSQTALGTTFSGNIAINMNSNISASIDQNGLAGSFGVHVDGSGTVAVSNWLIDQSVTMSGSSDANIGYVGNTLELYGNMTLNLPFSICIPFTSNCLDSITMGLNVSI